jgi:hypothetical protein
MALESVGAMVIESKVSKVSAPLRSSSTGPPLAICLDLSLRVRSPLIGVQDPPLSVLLNTTLPPR